MAIKYSLCNNIVTIFDKTYVMLPTIYFDESGNTGQDLLNEDQSIFVLASVSFTDDETETLKSLFEDDHEIHFIKLKKSSPGRKKILSFLNHELINESNVAISYANKEFITITQIVDQLIEHVLFHDGKNLYENGMNIIFSNVLYYSGMYKWNKSEFKILLGNFISMYRAKTAESIETFYNHVNIFSKSVEPYEYHSFFEPIIRSKNFIEGILEGVTKYTLDSTLSTFLVLCDQWHDQLNSKINVVFDDSKQISYYEDYIEKMKTMEISKQKVGYGPNTMTFPTQIENLTLQSSKDSTRIQFADVLASSTTFLFSNKNPKQNAFQKQLQSSRISDLENCHSIWPQENFTPESLGFQGEGGQSILDFLVHHEMKKS